MNTQKSSPLLTYSNWIQWVVVIIISGLVAFFYLSMDARYVTKMEVSRKEEQLHQIRMDDMAALNSDINKAITKADANNVLINRVDNKMSRIEAQNEMIIKALDNLTYSYKHQADNK